MSAFLDQVNVMASASWTPRCRPAVGRSSLAASSASSAPVAVSIAMSFTSTLAFSLVEAGSSSTAGRTSAVSSRRKPGRDVDAEAIVNVEFGKKKTNYGRLNVMQSGEREGCGGERKFDQIR